jgi:hypothetical protein
MIFLPYSTHAIDYANWISDGKPAFHPVRSVYFMLLALIPNPSLKTFASILMRIPFFSSWCLYLVWVLG